MEAIETINFDNGDVGKIFPDMDPESPRDWDNVVHIVCWHNRYRLGDEQPDMDPCDYEIPKGAVVLPLYLYDHNGLTLSTRLFSCPWDSSQIGCAFVAKKIIKATFGWDRLTKGRIKRIENTIESEVETYNQYLNGEVYGYILENADGKHIDSCWGLFDEEYCKDQLIEAQKNAHKTGCLR